MAIDSATTDDIVDPPASNGNLLLRHIEYAYEESPQGRWRRYLYDDGAMFAEYRSHAAIGRIPVVHITWGKCPETGRGITACGVIAIGRRATGMVAIGQLAIGMIAIGQAAFGAIFGLGQAATGIAAIGQASFAAMGAIGQLAYSGYAVIAQLGYGQYVLAQFGYGEHVIDMRGVDPIARDFFAPLFGW